MRAGKAAIEKATAMNAGTDRERGFITALNVYYNTSTVLLQVRSDNLVTDQLDRADRVVPYEKSDAPASAVSIRTISKPKPSTLSRSSQSVCPRPAIPVCRSN
jgi:hypothetical protein